MMMNDTIIPKTPQLWSALRMAQADAMLHDAALGLCGAIMRRERGRKLYRERWPQVWRAEFMASARKVAAQCRAVRHLYGADFVLETAVQDAVLFH